MSADFESLREWVEHTYVGEDALLRELRAEMEARGLPLIHVPSQTGLLLHVLVRAVGARRVIEVGTLGGYSAVWIGRALPAEARMVTIELEPERATLAREFLGRAGLEEKVEVIEGLASEVLVGLESGTWDVVFLDADKESYPDYLVHAARLLRPGGLLLADNAFWSGRVLESVPEATSTLHLQEFHRSLAASDQFASTVVAVGDGVAMGVRL